MGFNKGLFDFIGYMSFFDPIGTGRASDSLQQDDFSEDVQDDSAADDENACEDSGEI